MISRINKEEMANVLRKAIKAGVFDRLSHTSAIFYDLTRLEGRVKHVIKSFPENSLHTVSIKACPLTGILKQILKLDAGVEVSSFAELVISLEAGFPPGKISYYSPAKTREELRYALNAGVHINADNLQEIERIADILSGLEPKGSVGIRINPQVGMGTISATSMAGEYSKLGVPIKTTRDDLIKCFIKHPWLRGVHMNIGSQGYGIEMLVKGIKTVYDFVLDANELFRREDHDIRIEIFDIGGGLPAQYREEDLPVSAKQYGDALKEECPRLFKDEFRLVTEFGRFIFANSGWVASKVEYVKMDGGINTAIIHVGADLFLRKCYRPEDWHHDISLADNNGKIKAGSKAPYVIGGPLCFSGDVIAQDVELPDISEEDYVLIHDAGAYTLSTWSRHMSRPVPRVIGYLEEGAEFIVLKEAETSEDLFRFWS